MHLSFFLGSARPLGIHDFMQTSFFRCASPCRSTFRALFARSFLLHDISQVVAVMPPFAAGPASIRVMPLASGGSSSVSISAPFSFYNDSVISLADPLPQWSCFRSGSTNSQPLRTPRLSTSPTSCPDLQRSPSLPSSSSFPALPRLPCADIAHRQSPVEFELIRFGLIIDPQAKPCPRGNLHQQSTPLDNSKPSLSVDATFTVSEVHHTAPFTHRPVSLHILRPSDRPSSRHGTRHYLRRGSRGGSHLFDEDRELRCGSRDHLRDSLLGHIFGG